MIVVADTSPLIVLINIKQIDLLPRLFGTVLVPPEVMTEAAGGKASRRVKEFANHQPAWLKTQAPRTIVAGLSLHRGEEAAISLALEVRADLLLIDDRDGRLAAQQQGIPVAGTIGILERGATEHLLSLKAAFEALKRTDFWIPPGFLDTRLKLFEERERSARNPEREP